MLGLVLVLGASGVLALLTMRRPVWSCVAAIVVWSLLPAVASSIVTGTDTGPLATHPATWIVLTALVVQLVVAPEPLTRTVGDHPFVWLGLGLFVAVFVTATLAAGGAGLKTVADQVVGPLALFWLVTGCSRGRVRDLLLLRDTILAVALVQSLIAVAQFRAGSILVYESDFLTLYWFNPETATRWMGTLDSPLVLSTLVCVAAPLTVGLRRNWIRFPLLGAYFAAAAITQSRTGLAIVTLMLGYVLVRSRLNGLVKIGIAVAGVAVGWTVAGSALLAGTSQRLSDDTGSSVARGAAFRFGVEHWHEFFLVGDGSGASYLVAAQAGLVTSLENPLLMFGIDAGLVFATIYFVIQLWLPAARFRTSVVPGFVVAALVGAVVQLSFSSVASSSIVGSLVWCLVALAVASSESPLGPHADDDPAPRTPESAGVPGGHDRS